MITTMDNGKNGTTKTAIAIIGLFLTIAVGVYGYGYLHSQVDSQNVILNSHCGEDRARDEAVVMRVRKVEDAVITQTVLMTEMQKTLNKIENKLN